MLGLGAIEIEEATYSLGMCGHIVLRINESEKRYRVVHSMSAGWPGWQVSEFLVNRNWSLPKCMGTEAFIKLLPEGRGWTQETFIAAWAGFAAGYEKGKKRLQQGVSANDKNGNV